MANMDTSGTVYQQMVVPAPYHYHQTQNGALIQNVQHTQATVQKRETKKRKKTPGEGKSSTIASKKGQNSSYSTGMIGPNRGAAKSDCSRCNSRRKCFKHLNQKCKSNMNGGVSCKTPEQTVLQLKRHMLKLVSGEPGPVCKSDPRTGVFTLEVAKMYRLYLQEHEPQALFSITGEINNNYKPTVKQWLYRKILLDEFQNVDFLACKQHLVELKRALEEAAVNDALTGSVNKKKKTKIKAQAQAVAEFSYSNGSNERAAAGGVVSNLHNSAPVTTLHHTVVPTHHSAPHYQFSTSNLMSVGGVSCSAMTAVTPTSPPLHNSLTPYITSQVTSNILFGLGPQQQTTGTLQPNVSALQTLPGAQTNPSTLQTLPLPHPLTHQASQVTSPTQQQPLNLQTSQQQQQQQQHQNNNNAGTNSSNNNNNGMHIPPQGSSLPLTLSQSISSSTAGAIPLNLHNPYYVSLSPMLPSLHMATPPAQHTTHPAAAAPHHHHHHHVSHHHHHPAHHHHHPQQFQHNMAVAQHPQSIAGTATVAAFNHHAMY